MPEDDNSPIAMRHARGLFADWRVVPAIVLAVSGGPDSIALMWLAARWRRALARGPRLIAVTVDHGFRAAAAGEGRKVTRLARALSLPRPTPRWGRGGGGQRQAPGACPRSAASYDALDRRQAENRPAGRGACRALRLARPG